MSHALRSGMLVLWSAGAASTVGGQYAPSFTVSLAASRSHATEERLPGTRGWQTPLGARLALQLWRTRLGTFGVQGTVDRSAPRVTASYCLEACVGGPATTGSLLTVRTSMRRTVAGVTFARSIGRGLALDVGGFAGRTTVAGKAPAPGMSLAFAASAPTVGIEGALARRWRRLALALGAEVGELRSGGGFGAAGYSRVLVRAGYVPAP